MKATLRPDEASSRDEAKAAAVRIAMTVAGAANARATLYRVTREGDVQTEGTVVELSEHVGKIFADLQVGADVTSATALRSNEGLSCRGVSLHGAGFIVSAEGAANLGLGRVGMEASNEAEKDSGMEEVYDEAPCWGKWRSRRSDILIPRP